MLHYNNTRWGRPWSSWLWMCWACFLSPEGYVVLDQSANTTAERLVNKMFCHFDVPEELHNDQGWNFEAAMFSKVF